MYITIFVIIIVSALLYFLWKYNRRGMGKRSALRRDARRLLNTAHDDADEMIDRQISVLQERYPGNTEEWYLEKIIYDLERDR
ncbi:MAG: hypothetical protein AVO34_13800 [Firmicutes bacterium ML8_F2]|jgi:hypothetical protein|nr:MAG: hypothetical protein AVO34_13800 [Firmicutes bacterium ML8_F2]